MANKRVGARTPKSGPHIKARETSPQSTNERKPIFSFYYLQADYRVSDCTQQEKAELVGRLEELSQLTWGQIRSAPREGLGTETIAQNSIRRSIPSHISPDVWILACRFGSSARIVGYRDDEVFHLVWIDPKHQVY